MGIRRMHQELDIQSWVFFITFHYVYWNQTMMFLEIIGISYLALNIT